MGTSWTPDAEALDLLEHAGPFDRSAYRRAWCETRAGVQDAAFGARAPDGALAAVSLVREGPRATWPPLGYAAPVASRPLDRTEQGAFLAAARRALGVAEIGCRAVVLPGAPALHGGRESGATSVVVLGEAPPEAGFAKLARRSLRRSRDAGVELRAADGDASAFLRLYAVAAEDRETRYPAEVLRALGELGVARYYDALLDGEAISSMVVLTAPGHWMYLMGAQGERARETGSGYLVMAAILADAHAAGARAVNLGGSEAGGQALGGVAEFKRRVGATPAAVTELWSSTPARELRRRAARLRQRLGR